MSTEPPKPSREQAFVQFTLDRCQDKGTAAALKRADNPATEYQSWEHLAAFHIDLDNEYQRLPYATIAAAIAKAKAGHNGSVGIGRAIALCYETEKEKGSDNDQAKAKLRRLLSCETVQETCRILRPLFSLIESKAGISLDYAKLLTDLNRFNRDSQRIKSGWAQDFYRRQEQEAA